MSRMCFAKVFTVVVGVAVMIPLAQSSAHAAARAPWEEPQFTRYTPTPMAQPPCFPNPTLACVQGNRWGIQILVNGAPANVAASSDESAVFWIYTSDNWEVVAKVIDGCSVNGYWWFFGAGATGTQFSFTFHDYLAGRGVSYSSAYCPLADTGQIAKYACP